MNKSNKFYKKALIMQSKGYIDKAIELCEKSIAEDIKNNAAIDLKGMLLYLKGELKEAKANWELNVKLNKDSAAKKYLESLPGDEKKFEYYVKALKCIKEVKIKEALNLLHECEKSHYNSINIHNSIAICNIKQGNYNEANSHIDAVFKIDRSNEMALANAKKLEEINERKAKINSTKLIKLMSAVIAIAIVFTLAIAFKKYVKIPNIQLDKKTQKTAVKKEKKQLTKNENKKSVENNKASENLFKSEELLTAINNKDYEKIYYYEENFANKELSINDKVIMVKALEILKSDGVQYYYKTGSSYASKSDYANAEQNFLKAYKYGSNNYVYADVIYYLATSYKNTGDIENAIKYYTQYDSNFKNGSYEETVLYELAVIYKDLDKAKAKTYANELTTKYPKSFYINSIIQEILKE